MHDRFLQVFSTFFIVTFFVRKSDCLIIAKSHITICENTEKDPLNVVYNKKCEKKLVVVARVNSGQVRWKKERRVYPISTGGLSLIFKIL